MNNSTDLCVSDYDFVAATIASDGLFNGTETLDGILGLSPDSLFITSLFDDGMIESSIITFLLTLNPMTSSVTLGGFPNNLVLGETSTLNTNGDKYWTVDIQGISYGGQPLK